MANEIVDKNKLFEMLGYKPHEHQAKIHNSVARFIIPCCGRRFGKSIVAGHEITWHAMKPDQYIWIVGPTYKLGEKEYRVVYDDFKRKLRIPKIRASYNVKQGDMRIELPWNTIIEVVSAEKQDGLVGEGLDYACMSEAALHQMSTWDMFIRPALADKRGSAIFPSTPRGNNWYKGLYQLGQDTKQPQYDSWRFPTWFNTVMFPGGFDDPELVEIRNRVTEYYWDQEYAAQFTAREGKIYKEWDDTKHVIHNYKYNPNWPNWLAMDFGFSNAFACYDIQIDEQDNVYVWREYQVRHKTTWEHANYLLAREQPENYRVHAVAADPRGADSIATIQFVMRLPVQAHPMEQAIGHETVSRWLKLQPATKKPKLFVSDQCPQLIHQMAELETEKEIEGKPVREGQKKVNDHGPDAVRYFFNEWAVLGLGYGLEDVYGGHNTTEAEGFFIANNQIVMTGSGNNYDFGNK